MDNSFEKEIKAGERFSFGENWRAFLNVLSDEKIEEAKKSLTKMLNVPDLVGCTFLDAGCGSGLFSLAARHLGAKVFSFDFDPQSVACTRLLKSRYFSNDTDDDWTIIEASVLDIDFMKSLKQFDIVYSWGVLHHTGNLALALENIDFPLKKGGKLFIALYNDAGLSSRIWLQIKKIYNASYLGQLMMKAIFIPYYFLRYLLTDLFHGQNPVKRYENYKKSRGMSMYFDWIDWIGGYPFEVSKGSEVINLFKKKNYVSVPTTIIDNGAACNELVLLKAK